MSNWKELIDSELGVEDEVEDRLEEPSKYHVFLLNDDYTPMDFVIDVLCRYFNMSTEQATDIMFKIHYQEKGLCGTFSFDIAESKVDQVLRYAHENQHPLKCVLEKA